MKAHSILYHAVARLLRPLVSLLIKHEFSHREFAELAKKVYVDVARSEFALPNRKCTVSRIAVLTGLSRKDVVRISAETDGGEKASKAMPNRAARVVTGWLNDPIFNNGNSGARPLALRGEGSFAQLVERYSGDITAGAILDELVRIGVANRDKKDQVILEKQGYIPDQCEFEKIDILFTCAADLLNSGNYNINKEEQQPARFQRQLTHREIPYELAAEFADFSSQQSLSLLLELDKWVTKKMPNFEEGSADASTRIGLGIYFFEDQNNE